MREHRYAVYIMASHSGTLYIGMTNDIYDRAMQHKGGEGCRFTTKYGCTRLVYYETYRYVRSAIKREKYLKGAACAKSCTDRDRQSEVGGLSCGLGEADRATFVGFKGFLRSGAPRLRSG